MKCKLPELVFLLQDSSHQVFKDICMDGEECSLENCELNHHNIYYMLKYELDNNAELENKVSASKPESCKGTVKQIDDSKKLLMEGKADTEIADAIYFSHDVPERQSLERELVDQKENQDQELKPVSMASKFVSKEACCDKSRIADSISREVSVQNTKAENRPNVENGTPRSLASLFADQNTEKLPDREDKNPAIKQCHDNISIRSSSTNSTKSFAFPVLTSEWPGSPVKMLEADKSDSKRRSCCWRMCFDFCRF